MVNILQSPYSNEFSWNNFDQTALDSKGPLDNKSVFSGDGLAQNRRHNLIWTNDDSALRCMSASLSLNVL